MFAKVKKFFTEVISELQKVSWSTKQELIDSTWLVVISSACLGIFIAVADFALSKIIGYIIR